MADTEKAAQRIHRAAEREHAGDPGRGQRGRSDSDSADAHVDVTEAEQGRPPLNRDWRDKPVDQERDKDIKKGGLDGAGRRKGRRLMPS